MNKREREKIENLLILEEKLSYRFNDRSLLINALTHSSHLNDGEKKSDSNERLEFLGDAFLDAVIGEKLFRIFPDENEGVLSRIRSTIVCRNALVEIGNKFELGEFILLGKGEDRSGGRSRRSIIADGVEALIGAMYLDGGYDPMKNTVLTWFEEIISDAEKGVFLSTDYKSALQEEVQKDSDAKIRYIVTGEEGPDHEKTFTVELHVNGRMRTEGRGRTKKQAEQEAARAMLEREYDAL